ncbi:hypothetical protein ACOMHN_032885 [Nucella lapillus]
MLFCFGLFALLLYNTVVANAECSYTYRNSSQQHIEAQSSDYEKQGFRRCEFLIQLGDPQQQIELNFTSFSGFGRAAPNASRHGAATPQGPSSPGPTEEEKEAADWAGQSAGTLQEDFQLGGEQNKGPSSSPTTTSARAVVLGSKLSFMVSSPPPPPPPSPREQPHSHPHPTHNTAYANTNASSDSSGETLSSSSSSLWTTTSVPRGGLFGEGEEGPCLPVVEIREVTEQGEEKTRHRICRQHENTQTPIVFHYASSVRIVYEWKQRQSSGFTLYFDFSSSEYGKCVHKCDGSRCLTEAGLLCNGQADCRDRSDEGTPACPLSTSVATSDPLEVSHLVQIVVIPTSVLVVGVVICVVCLLARRHHHHYHHSRWPPHTAAGLDPSSPSSLASSSSPRADDMQPHPLHHHHHHHHHLHQQHPRGNGHAAVHLHCPQSHSSEGLTSSGCSNPECSNEQAVALLPNMKHSHHKHTRHPPAPPPHCSLPDPEVGLPPNIPVSPDGEEGYSASQLRLLDRRSRTAHSELFKPPPNKTVFDRESPPPYSLTPSPGTYGCGSPLAPPPSPPHSVGRGGTGGGGGGGGYLCGPERVIRDSEGQPVVSRCYTMFSGAPPSRPPPRRHTQLPAFPRLHPHPHHPPHNHHQAPEGGGGPGGYSPAVVAPRPAQRCPPDDVAPSTHCDPPLPPSSPSPPFGAFITAQAALLHHPPSSSPSPLLLPPSSNGEPPPPRCMPSETVSDVVRSSRSTAVDSRSRGDSDWRNSAVVSGGGGGGGDCLVSLPPSYQMVLTQDLWEGRGSGAVEGGASPRAASSPSLTPHHPSLPPPSPSPSPSPATATSSTSTTSMTFNNNNSRGLSGV